MLYADLQLQSIVRMGIDTTSTFITETMIRNWLDMGHKWAASYKKWPMTEYMDISGTFTNGTIAYNYPNTNFKTDSIRGLAIGSMTAGGATIFDKKIFTDFAKYMVDYPTGTDEIFSDYGRILYINPNCTSGTIMSFGQLTPPTLGLVASSTASTVFSNYDEEGDDAIIDKVCSYGFRRMKKFQEAIDFENRARMTLDELWKRIQDEQALYQTKDRPIWERFNVVKGENENENPLQF